MEEMEKSHNAFLQGAQQELKKEMAVLQKKILIDTVGAHRKRLHKQEITSFHRLFELVQPKLDFTAI